MDLHPSPLTEPIPCGKSLDGITTPEDQLSKLLDAGLRYRSFKYWAQIRVDRSEQDITGSGFNCVKFDPRKPARTIRRNDGNLGMHGAMHWDQRRRFSLEQTEQLSNGKIRYQIRLEKSGERRPYLQEQIFHLD